MEFASGAIVGFVIACLGFIFNNAMRRRYTKVGSGSASGNSNYAAALLVLNEFYLTKFSPYYQHPSFGEWLRHRLHSEEPNVA